MKNYLEETEIIDFKNEEVFNLAFELSKDCKTDEEIAKNCFTYVRDNINHSGDFKDEITTCKASDVLKYKTGWCYAKSHLLAALLRANGIPAGFCYQRLSCSEYKKDIYCLHGLNAIYLKNYGWYKIDARGNKEGVNAQFNPPFEELAFKLEKDEFDLPNIYSKPLDVVIEALKKNKTYDEMINIFPNVSHFIGKAKTFDALRLSQITNELTSYIFEKEVPKWFEDELLEESFKERILSDEYEYFIYVIENKIVGFITIKNKNHLFHLFVDEKYHKKGIAKKLWQYINEHFDVSNMSVNASLFSIKTYESFGFKISGEQSEYLGLNYQPMSYKC
ncbi:putative acetyltransferase/transglutaminase [Arcobacter venerupis]|uniref:Acetyltransferase/transglutaminase n=1 Tax=Arcobacter venerupis TaxID=1054033 RepID=A0AAE7E524_9BACT|nr:GNAT family N-acetyltransferase [Arcobacter venerupis]QKF67346.1 putative acetyltransferase/transglutaminase [Arcobacter venerupis]